MAAKGARRKPKRPAKKQDAQEREDSGVYAGILDHKTLRKTLLGISRDIIVLKQRIEKLSVLREQRSYIHAELRKSSAELTASVIEVDSVFPELPPEPEPDVQQMIEATALPEPQPVERDFGSLERELAEIDRKLKELEKS